MARYDEEGRKIEGPAHAVGADIAALSVEELQARIVLMRDEITRLEAAIQAKTNTINAANAIFKS